MDEITVPIYLITGFLESGKTSFLSFTLQQDYFRTEGKTLLILCEEGEEEYDEEALAKDNVVVGCSPTRSSTSRAAARYPPRLRPRPIWRRRRCVRCVRCGCSGMQPEF